MDLARKLRIGAVVAACIVALLIGASMEAGAVVAYEIKGHIIVHDDGWNLGRSKVIPGQAPAISPSRDSIAFLRKGNVFLIRGKSGSVVQVTRDQPMNNQDTYWAWGLRVVWDRSGRYLAYTRVLPFKYDKRRNTLLPAAGQPKPSDSIIYLSTLWLADAKQNRSRLLVSPMGDLKKMNATGQLGGAEVYEPVISPDSKSLWLLNGGSLYQMPVDLGAMKPAGKVVLVATIGSGLDFKSTGASKAGSGAQQMGWDVKHSRLCYWIGRFWGTGYSEYGYISWRGGKWGKPTKWKPDFAASIGKAMEWTNVQGCMFDDRGWFWVNAFTGNDFCWIRQDAKYRLPVNTERPDWGSWNLRK